MKKQAFNITTASGSSTVRGYIFSVDGLQFGVRQVHNKINSAKTWLVTELSSGKYIPYDYRTRKNAIDGVESIIDTIKSNLQELVTG